MNRLEQLLWFVFGFALLSSFSISQSFAHPSFKKQFAKVYKDKDKRLFKCILCHLPEDTDLNPYGKDFQKANFDFKAIENLDSDGDGFTNIREINYPSWPGDSSSHPKEGVMKLEDEKVSLEQSTQKMEKMSQAGKKGSSKDLSHPDRLQKSVSPEEVGRGVIAPEPLQTPTPRPTPTPTARSAD